MKSIVAITSTASSYPLAPPFHPRAAYPEYPFGGKAVAAGSTAYDAVRNTLLALELDVTRRGTPRWNPFREMVSPGQVVLIKPNMVLDRHPRGGDLNCLVTHGSVIRAVLDYVFIALQGKGRVIIGDSPLQTTDFAAVTEAMGLAGVVRWYRQNTSLDVQLVDFRQVHAEKDERGHVRTWKEVPGDPAGYVSFDLGHDSMLTPIEGDSDKFRVSNYRADDTRQYHGPASHRYVIAGSVIDADLIISVPKMKTHCKVGVTLSLKNFVGTVGRKQCLAHHREGGADEGGDEFPGHSRLKRISERLERVIDGRPGGAVRVLSKLWYRVNERVIRELNVDPTRDGGWYGNDTAWRMTLDLDRIALYGRRDGTLADTLQRRIFTVVDGIIAGENEGPLEATPAPAGLIVAGDNPLAVDAVTATIMGFDYRKINMLAEAFHLKRWPIFTGAPSEIRVRTDSREVDIDHAAGLSLASPFKPALGWVGHIERQPTTT